MAESVDAAVDRLRKSSGPFLPDQRRALADLHRAVSDLRRNLERQASYLVDVVTPDARRRRSKQSLANRFDAGARLVAHIAERRGIRIDNRIPADLKSPPMFPAELTTTFSNLLSNAVKAAGENGRIRARGKRIGASSVVLLIENTGSKVDLEHGERWFRPFESTTTQVQATLGQGMGLGLPITRNMLEEYGASIRFVKPSAGFSTAIELVFPAA
jgi:signal transduction histidine kinase